MLCCCGVKNQLQKKIDTCTGIRDKKRGVTKEGMKLDLLIRYDVGGARTGLNSNIALRLKHRCMVLFVLW